MSARLNKAIADFEDDTLDLTLGERISSLRSALMMNAFDKLKKIGKKKEKGEEYETDENHIARMDYFKDIVKMYESELRMNKLTGKSIDKMDKDFLKRVKDEKGSMGNIVVKLNADIDGNQ